MSISERASAGIKAIPEKDRPLSEEYRLAAKEWVDLDSAASLLEELRTTVLEQKKSNYIALHGEMADNKVERIVKSSADWEQYIRDMLEARKKANLAKVKIKWIEMRATEWMSAGATARAEMKMR